MLFKDVASGEAWQAEPASRYNAVNELLDNADTHAEVLSSAAARSSVTVFNVSEKTIPQYSAVSIDGIFSANDMENQYARYDNSCILRGTAAKNDDLPWGIAAEDILSGEIGEVVVSGAVPAFFSGSGERVAPSSAGLTAGNRGNASVLLTPDKVEGNTLPGLIIMGSASSETEDYRGIFLLRGISANQLEIVYGSQPQYSYCGYTDVPGCTIIPKTVLDVPCDTAVEISLQFFYDSGRYTYRFCAGQVPDNAVFGTVLGIFDRGKTTQLYRGDSNRMTFGNDWYLA